MTEQPNPHILEDIQVYLANGLSPENRQSFESHLTQCPACTAALAEAQKLETMMTAMFANAGPAEGFEDRIIQKLRSPQIPRRLILHPMVRRAAIGVAAAVVLAGAGAIVNNALNTKARYTSTTALSDAANLHQVGRALEMYKHDFGKYPAASAPPNNDVEANKSEIRYQVQTNLDQARTGVQQQNWSTAQIAIDRARLASSVNPTIFNADEIRKVREQIDQTELNLRQSQDQAKQVNDTTVATDIQTKIDAERRQPMEDRQRTIADLIRTSKNLSDQGKFKEALQTADQILVLDSKNDYAAGVKPLLEDKVQLASRQTEQRFSRTPDQLARSNEMTSPYNDIMRYPTDWPDLTPNSGRPSLATAGKTYQPSQARRDVGLSYGLALKDSDADGAADSGLVNTRGFKPMDELKLNERGITGKELKDAQFGEQDKKAVGERQLGRELAAAEKQTEIQSGFFAVSKTQDLKPAVQAVSNGQVPPDPFAGTGTTQPASLHKVIRNGTMQFEVDRFDDALMRVTKLVNEQGGYIATTDSDKLPNGKMKGVVTLRVPPERLDVLVLTLRGIGDLKSQKIGAEDVTKHYTDLESQLRAARAMQDRLIDIIKTGKGQIKDLLEAEKQLGVWREKIEQIEGEKRYLDNAVALSTLNIEMAERDIRTPATASEVEQVTMSLETEKVDESYQKARAAIEGAKGRIIQSELKQYDAGQFGATIQGTVPPDAAEEVIARLRQLDGRIAHFERQNKRTTQPGEGPVTGVTALHREDAIISMQIYNLANIAPRRTTTILLATTGVDAAYQKTLDQIHAAGGRIVTSSLSKPDAQKQSADLEFQVPTEKSQTVDDALHTLGEVMRNEATENPDTANVTEAKRGFRLRIVSSASITPRERQDAQLAALDVSAAFNQILAAVNAAGGRVLQSDLKEQDPHDKTANLSFEIPRSSLASLSISIDKAAQILTRNVTRSADTENTLDSKVWLIYSLVSAEHIAPRQTVTIREEVADVEKAADDMANAAITAGGRRIGNGEASQDQAGHETAQVVIEVPMDKAPAILDQIEKMGHRRGKQVSYDSRVPDGALTRARIDVTFSNTAVGLGGDESLWDAIRHGLETSGQGLRWSLQMLVIGACFVAPWVLVIWAIWKMVRRSKRKSQAATAVA